jgi:hypothetical protein
LDKVLAEIRKPVPVKPICGLLFSADIPLERITPMIEVVLGKMEERTPVFHFNYTDYYADEMGDSLLKLFISFNGLVHAAKLIRFKIATNRIENEWKSSGRRRVNIDPGYITAAKVVLATTKDYTHRLYLGGGIYGDVQLAFTKGSFRPNSWTYPDYRSVEAVDFFNRVKNRYMEQYHHDKPDDL